MTFKSAVRFNLRTLLTGLTLGLTIAVALSVWTLELVAQIPSATDDLRRHTKYLASEELTGRGVDTPGIRLARDYIAGEFAKYGLQPGGDGGYLQGFDVAIGVTVKEPSSLALGSEAPSTLNDDWIPLGLSTSAKTEAQLVLPATALPPRTTVTTTTRISTSRAKSFWCSVMSHRPRTTRARLENYPTRRLMPRCAPRPTTPGTTAPPV